MDELGGHLKQIPLKAIERQSLSVMLEGELYDIEVKECLGVMAISIKRGEEVILDFRRACAGIPLIPRGRSDMGNFIFTSFNDELPYFNRFESTDQLYYVTLEEIGTLDPDKLIELPTPLSKPLVKIDGLTDTSLPNYVTLDRDTSATYVDRLGVITSSIIDSPRFELNGLLLEEASENVFSLNSSSIFSWLSSGVTQSAGTATSPFIGFQKTLTSSNYDPLSNDVYAADMYGHPNPLSSSEGFISVSAYLFGDADALINARPYFSLVLGKPITKIVSSTIKINPNCVRVLWTGYLPSGGGTTFTNFQFRWLNRLPPFNIAGYQLEVLPQVTSYIPKNSSPVIRVGDDLTYSRDDAKWVYVKYLEKGVVKKLLYPYAGELVTPRNINIQELLVWNREPTDEEKLALGV